MSNKIKLSENTLVSTPRPIHSSSMTSESQKKASMNLLDDIPQRLSDIDSSLGTLSIDSGDCYPFSRSSTSSLKRQQELQEAVKSMKNFDMSRKAFTSLPSRFLRESDVSDRSSFAANLGHFESTISESDLLANSSTPRESLADAAYFVSRDRPSIGSSIASLANSLRKGDVDMNRFLKEVHTTINSEEVSFQSGTDFLAKLQDDEISYQNRRAMPADFKEISEMTIEEGKVSMGSFFIKKSDEDLSEFFAKSPTKSRNPIPLIETSVYSQNTSSLVDASLGLTDIQHILSSSESINSGLHELLKAKKARKSRSPVRTSLPSDEKEIKRFSEARKENISPELHSEKARSSSGLSRVRTPLDQNEARKPISPLRASLRNDNNEVRYFAEARKENISPELHEKSTRSSRSSTALSTLPNGKLPIATTKTEIIWGCLKPGKSSSQEFTIRNRSSSRLGIQCAVCNPSFRLHKEGTELNFSSMVKVVLHPYEARSLTVTFAPTTLGASVDILNFTSMDPAHQQTTKQFVRLYGYGGYGNVAIHKIIKDTSGKFLLSLGNIDHEQALRQSFAIKNFGSLAAFAYCNFIQNGMYSFSNIEISPAAVVLLPGEERDVVVSYNLQKKDHGFIKSKINSAVIDIGKLQVVHGTEVDRARLRRLCQKAKERNHDVKSSVLELAAQFPGEVLPNDVKLFRESLSSMDEMMRFLNNEEITLTFEQDHQHDATGQLPNETAMFYSLCENTDTSFKESCQVEPTSIILTPPDKIKDKVLLRNNNKKKMYFEIKTTPGGLDVQPREGTINPGETVFIEVQYTKKCNEKTVFKVTILVDDESFEVGVKVVFVNRI